MKPFKFSVLIPTILLFCEFGFSDVINTKIHNQYSSTRALGMGNAFTAVADDYSLIFYNPAAFAFKEKGELQFSLIGLGVANRVTQFAKEITDAEKASTTESAKITAISNVMDQYYGKPISLRSQFAEIFYVRKNWGFALLPVDLSMDIIVNKQLGPALDVNLRKDTTFAFGYGDRNNDEWSFGGMVKAIHRGSVEQSLPVLELAANSDVASEKRFADGLNIDLELGALYKPKWFGMLPEARVPAQENKEEPKSEGTNLGLEVKNENPIDENKEDENLNDAQLKKQIEKSSSDVEAKPAYYTPLTLSVVARNVLGGNFAKTKYINKNATEAPSKNPFVIDVGSGYEIVKLGDLVFRAALDFKNLLHPQNSNFLKGTHAGVELDYSPSGWFKAQLRGGVNQGYYTVGTTLLLGVLNIDLLTFGEEVGSSTTKIENRVTALKIGLNF